MGLKPGKKKTKNHGGKRLTGRWTQFCKGGAREKGK